MTTEQPTGLAALVNDYETWHEQEIAAIPAYLRPVYRLADQQPEPEALRWEYVTHWAYSPAGEEWQAMAPALCGADPHGWWRQQDDGAAVSDYCRVCFAKACELVGQAHA